MAFTTATQINSIDQAKVIALELRESFRSNQLKSLSYRALRTEQVQLKATFAKAAGELEAVIASYELSPDFDYFESDESPWENTREAKQYRHLLQELRLVDAEIATRRANAARERYQEVA